MSQSTTQVPGRWTVFVCTGCGECTGRHQACDAKRESTPVVPVDEASRARAVEAIVLVASTASSRTYEDLVDTVIAALAEKTP